MYVYICLNSHLNYVNGDTTSACLNALHLHVLLLFPWYKVYWKQLYVPIQVVSLVCHIFCNACAHDLWSVDQLRILESNPQLWVKSCNEHLYIHHAFTICIRMTRFSSTYILLRKNFFFFWSKKKYIFWRVDFFKGFNWTDKKKFPFLYISSYIKKRNGRV